MQNCLRKRRPEATLHGSRSARSQAEILLRRDPDDVFKALTKPKRLAKWFLKDAKINPKEGSSYTFTWQGWFGRTGKVVKVVPDKVLALSWSDKIEGELYPTRVSFTLTKKGKGGSTGFGAHRVQGRARLGPALRDHSVLVGFLTNLKSAPSERSNCAPSMTMSDLEEHRNGIMSHR
jgi:uncharacterized protein YndB with AHSA1/START domain